MSIHGYLKWVTNCCYVSGTILLLSPTIAATAVTPWVLFITGNFCLFYTFLSQKEWAFVCLSVFFFVWDALTIISRLTNFEYFSIILPLISTLENHIL